MESNFSGLKVFEFAGNEHEIGRAYGESCRDSIKECINWWYDTLKDVLPGKSLADMVECNKQFKAPIEAASPELFSEMQGIAEGSGCTIDEIVYLQSCAELDSGGSFYMMGCTSFATAGDATLSGQTITGQNLDWFPNSEPIILRIKPLGKPAYLTLTWPGQLGMMGITELGTSLFINILAYPELSVGVPTNVLANLTLLQKNVPDMIRVITQNKRTVPFNYLFAGKDGEMIDVESTPGKCGCVMPEDDILTHSNHFLTPYLQDKDLGDQTSFPDTFLRQLRLKKLMKKHYGQLTPEIMMKLMQDHQGYPDSICRHCDLTGPSYEQFDSGASVVAVPGEGKMYATSYPCQNPYKLYTL